MSEIGELADMLRDECLALPEFSGDYPLLVRQDAIDDAGSPESLRALTEAGARVGWFSDFVWREIDALPDDKRAELLEES